MDTTLRTGTPEEVGMSPDRLERARQFAEGLSKRDEYPAIVVLVARRGVIALHEAFGCMGPESDSEVLRTDAIFPLTSQTKPVTATLAMNLVEDGLLDLECSVAEYIPEFVGEDKDKVMVHHLLTHTSGITGKDIGEEFWDNKHKVEYEELLPILYRAQIHEKPGSIMKYCDFNYHLLGDIICRLSGKSIEEFGKERIFDPLELGDTHYETPDSARERIVRRSEDAPYADGIKFWIDKPVGSDGLISTTMDMAVFGQMFLNRGVYGDARILSPASIAQMTRNQTPGVIWRHGEEEGSEASWSFGWGIYGTHRSGLRSPETLYHGGAGTVFLWVDPVYEIVSAFFSVLLRDKKLYREIRCFANAVTAAAID